MRFLLFVVALTACENTARPAVPEASTPAPTPAARSTSSARVTPSAQADATARAEPPEPARPWPAKRPPPVEADWCIEGVSVLDAESCYVLPDTPTRTLLIYLHGIVPPTEQSIQKTNFENVVKNASLRAKSAALIPRGKQGLAPKGHEKWWGWPTGAPSYRKHGPELLDKIVAKQKLLEDVAGVGFDQVYVAGSSSGAYFAAQIALHGGLDADGFGAMSGGAGGKTDALEKLAPKPFYIGFGKHDSVAGGARALGQLLKDAGWPVQIAEHSVGHGAKEIYIDEAFEFWRRHAEHPR